MPKTSSRRRLGRDQARVDDTVGTLSKNGNAWGITADLDDVRRVQDTLAAEHADATLMVNSAGFFVPRAFVDYDGAEYDAYLELARSAFFLTQTVTRGMIAAGGGAIVNIGSMWAHQAIAVTPGSGYSMGKAALHALTHKLAMEFADHKIRVNAVAPAVVATPLYEAFVPKDQLEATLNSFKGFHPLGRVGTAEDIASAVTYLLSARCQLGHRRDPQRRRRRHGGSEPGLTQSGRSHAVRTQSSMNPFGNNTRTRPYSEEPYQWPRHMSARPRKSSD